MLLPPATIKLLTRPDPEMAGLWGQELLAEARGTVRGVLPTGSGDQTFAAESELSEVGGDPSVGGQPQQQLLARVGSAPEVRSNSQGRGEKRGQL